MHFNHLPVTHAPYAASLMAAGQHRVSGPNHPHAICRRIRRIAVCGYVALLLERPRP